MFTLEEIASLHQKVKTGADFPQYARDLTSIGVTGYDTFVSDGHAEYSGNPTLLVSPEKYPSLKIADDVQAEKFIERLKIHQGGGSDYMTFCQDCAACGVEKWTLDMVERTCTYYDSSGQSVLVEHFPG